jgi:hypothetical protein
VKRCPGWPLGSCLTNIEEERELCSFCTRTLTMLLGCAREGFRLRPSAMLNLRRYLHTRTTPGFGLTAGTGLRFARRVELEQGPETMAAARPAAEFPDE